MRILATLTMLSVLAAMSDMAAAACRAESGAKLLPLVELYTSEGCNSCPPADRWLSTHFPPGAHSGAVALAFHVDYWDRLGWKDRFASPVFTERQYRSMRANRATFVYTPQVLLQGRDFTEWRRGSPADALAAAASRPARADIGMSAQVSAEGIDVDLTVKLADPLRRDTILGVAYTDSALRTDVKAGENRGVVLRHDHVVRALETRPLPEASSALRIRLPRPAEAGNSPLIVAFVQHAGSGDVLQAAALPLQACER